MRARVLRGRAPHERRHAAGAEHAPATSAAAYSDSWEGEGYRVRGLWEARVICPRVEGRIGFPPVDEAGPCRIEGERGSAALTTPPPKHCNAACHATAVPLRA
jgi:hypothetical protein